MLIVDAHHHLWDLAACHYPWLMARGVTRFFGDPTPIQKNYLIADLRQDAGEFDLGASVHVQVGVAPGEEIRESAWLQQTREESDLPSAIVAYCDLASPQAPTALESQLSFPAVRGIRQIVGRSEAEDAETGSSLLLDDPVWRENFVLLGELGLSFDLQMTPGQLPRVAEVLASASSTKIALCHCGSPWDQTAAGLASWRSGLRRLAALPQVHCKISGLGMFDHEWTTESIRPIVESCIEIFGVDRCMFGSNFPVDKLHATYEKIWRAYDTICGELGAAERSRLFCDNALQFYRIDRASAFAPASNID